MTTQKKILPKIYPTDKKIDSTWFVGYLGLDGKRKKVYGNLNKLHTLNEKLCEAQRIIDTITASNTYVDMPYNGNTLLHDLQTVFDYRKAGWSKKTTEAFYTHFTAFAKWYRQVGTPTVDIIVATNFLNYLTAKGANNTTRNNYRNNLKSLFLHLQKYFKHRYFDNAFADAILLKESRKTKQWYSPVQVQKLTDYMAKNDTQLLLSVKIMYHCFVRPNEIRLLKIKNINWETSRFTIDATIAKTNTTRYVNIPAALLNELAYLKNYDCDKYIFTLCNVPGHTPYGRDTLSKCHKKILTKLGFGSEYSYYSWKNTGAVKMLCQDKRNLRYISKCMGHHSLDMTDNYLESLGVNDMEKKIFFPTF